jgi:hypothetical protein
VEIRYLGLYSDLVGNLIPFLFDGAKVYIYFFPNTVVNSKQLFFLLDGDRINRLLVLVVVFAVDEAIHSLVCVEIASSTPTTTPTTTTMASIWGWNGSSIRLDNEYDQKISSTPPTTTIVSFKTNIIPAVVGRSYIATRVPESIGFVTTASSIVVM